MRKSTKSPSKRTGNAPEDDAMAAWLLQIAADANAHTKDALVAGGPVLQKKTGSTPDELVVDDVISSDNNHRKSVAELQKIASEKLHQERVVKATAMKAQAETIRQLRKQKEDLERKLVALQGNAVPASEDKPEAPTDSLSSLLENFQLNGWYAKKDFDELMRLERDRHDREMDDMEDRLMKALVKLGIYNSYDIDLATNKKRRALGRMKREAAEAIMANQRMKQHAQQQITCAMKEKERLALARDEASLEVMEQFLQKDMHDLEEVRQRRSSGSSTQSHQLSSPRQRTSSTGRSPRHRMQHKSTSRGSLESLAKPKGMHRTVSQDAGSDFGLGGLDDADDADLDMLTAEQLDPKAIESGFRDSLMRAMGMSGPQ
eukprot:m.206167 g.206167  ORF g.206167 m.206167 type:complete len:375 (+) comp18891_c0_seq3:300-1424(+)